jgi:hypothetical protein
LANSAKLANPLVADHRIGQLRELANSTQQSLPASPTSSVMPTGDNDERIIINFHGPIYKWGGTVLR